MTEPVFKVELTATQVNTIFGALGLLSSNAQGTQQALQQQLAAAQPPAGAPQETPPPHEAAPTGAL